MSSIKRVYFKILLLGDSGVGKTSLMKQLVDQQFSSEYKPTAGADFASKDFRFEDGQTATIQIWDTAGQERFKSLGSAFYRGADAAVLIYDITSKKSFQNLQFWKTEFFEYVNPTNFPVMIVCNKADLADRREVTADEAESWCQQNGNLHFFETSAKDPNCNLEKENNPGNSLDQLFNLIATKVVEKWKQQDPNRVLPITEKKVEASGCCK